MAQDRDPQVEEPDAVQALVGVERRIDELLGEVDRLRSERARLLIQVSQQGRALAEVETRIADLLRTQENARLEAGELLGTLAELERRMGADEHD